jgi:hypothetical protein
MLLSPLIIISDLTMPCMPCNPSTSMVIPLRQKTQKQQKDTLLLTSSGKGELIVQLMYAGDTCIQPCLLSSFFAVLAVLA